jgi:hypothetical protein
VYVSVDRCRSYRKAFQVEALSATLKITLGAKQLEQDSKHKESRIRRPKLRRMRLLIRPTSKVIYPVPRTRGRDSCSSSRPRFVARQPARVTARCRRGCVVFASQAFHGGVPAMAERLPDDTERCVLAYDKRLACRPCGIRSACHLASSKSGAKSSIGDLSAAGTSASMGTPCSRLPLRQHRQHDDDIARRLC